MLGWATGNLPEPRNNPQVGMANMRAIMPALQRAKAAPVAERRPVLRSVSLPKQQRETRIVKNMPPEEIAREIVAWIAGGITWKRFCFLAHTEADGTLAKPALEALRGGAARWAAS